jgi:hypothetical protein
VGVPRVVEENGKTVLKLIRQEHLEDESIEVIFLDEYNRAPKKMKNAVMELIQFKSVNGKKFPNLKAVWASINPDDSSGTYDVEPLDPAQYDRFHVHLKVDYRPCPVYLENKYGSRMAAAALEWWGALTATMKDTVSPRRLCYALDFYLEDGDIRDILPEDTNVSRLIELLVTKPIDVLVQEIYDSKDAHETKAFINNENNLMKALEIIKSKPEYQDYFFPNLNNERASSLLSDEQVRKNILSNISNFPNYEDLIKGVLQANANKALVEEITIDYLKNDIRVESIDHIINKSVNTDASCYTAENDVPISKALTALSVEYNIGNLTPAQRIKVWNKIIRNMPDALSIEDAKQIGQWIEALVAGNKKDIHPWLKYDNFIPVLNQVSKCLFKNGLAPSEIRALMPMVYKACQFSDEMDNLYIKC